MDDLVEVRDGQEFTDITSLIKRANSKIIQKRQLESLIKSGSLDNLDSNRARLLNSVEYLTKYCQQFEIEKNSNQQSLFGGADNKDEINIILPNISDFTYKEKLQNEFEAYGFYLTEHPLDKFTDLLKQENVTTALEFANITDASKEITIAGVIISYKQRSGKNGRFVTLNLSDPFGVIDVSIFDENLISEARDLLSNGSTVIIDATVRNDDSGTRVMAKTLKGLDVFLDNKSKLVIYELEKIQDLSHLNSLLSDNPGQYPINLQIKYLWKEEKININTRQKFRISPDILPKLLKNSPN